MSATIRAAGPEDAPALSSWAFNVDAHETFRRIGFRPKAIRFELYL